MGATYGKQAIAAILHFDWSLLPDWYEVRETGIFVLPPSALEVRSLPLFDLAVRLPDEPLKVQPGQLVARVAHPQTDIDQPALPFPFTEEDFFAFCDSCPLFSWDRLELIYSNDDKALDENALAALRSVSRPAERLARAWLSRESAPYSQSSAGPLATPTSKSGTRSKLSEDQRKAIRARLKRGESVSALGREFDVSRRTIDKCKPTPASKNSASTWIPPVAGKKGR